MMKKDKAVFYNEKGLSVKEIAVVLGVDSATVEGWLTPKRTKGSMYRPWRQKALEMHAQGMSVEDIATASDVTEFGVQRWISVEADDE